MTKTLTIKVTRIDDDFLDTQVHNEGFSDSDIVAFLELMKARILNHILLREALCDTGSEN